MDVQLIASSALDLPSSERVDAIAHGGGADLRVWPGPGPDRELSEHYGSELNSQLDREKKRLDSGLLPIGEMLRLHRGKLHCDFLLWIAMRGPEVKGVRAKAPDGELITKCVKDALAFASLRHVARMALPALGDGPDALDEVERVVRVAKAANAYYDECYAAGRPAGLEEVLVCHRSQAVIAAARRALGSQVKVISKPVPVKSASAPKRRRTTSTRKNSPAKRISTPLTEADISLGRATAAAYDRARKWEIGELMIHSKFGVGRVQEQTAQGFIIVLFEGGQSKRLLHNRP
ncbi:MAG: hypothetical protein AB8I08_34630 [Sandaracinaceae bacterium]